jgi:hypothetical protein
MAEATRARDCAGKLGRSDRTDRRLENGKFKFKARQTRECHHESSK